MVNYSKVNEEHGISFLFRNTPRSVSFVQLKIEENKTENNVIRLYRVQSIIQSIDVY